MGMNEDEHDIFPYQSCLSRDKPRQSCCSRKKCRGKIAVEKSYSYFEGTFPNYFWKKLTTGGGGGGGG